MKKMNIPNTKKALSKSLEKYYRRDYYYYYYHHHTKKTRIDKPLLVTGQVCYFLKTAALLKPKTKCETYIYAYYFLNNNHQNFVVSLCF